MQIDNLHKSFAGQRVLDGIGFAAGEHEFVCLLGPSGCGKTTLLRIIAGLLEADGGTIRLGTRELTPLPAQQRNIGLVFQSYSLFPTMTVAQNIGYGMRLRRATRASIAARCEELLALVRMPDAAARYPAELSGGQQQRVALARALAVDPGLLLLDEPLSALDARVREQLRGELRQLQRSLAIPTLMVTHDQEEALSMADRIVCMNQGRIEQIAAPRELYLRPRTAFVAGFVGESNLLPTAWIREVWPELLVHRPSGSDDMFVACVRPEDVLVRAEAEGTARMGAATFRGATVRWQIEWRGRQLLCEQHRDTALAQGDAVSVSVRPDRCTWVRA
nr:ATP-binding cassette domain-containing protein [Oleiagrimonas sp. C23AA]